jgi:hypothetical protein
MSAGDSARLFRAVADPAEPAGLLLLTSIAKAILWRWLALDVAGSFLFNTGHVGLENRFHAWALRWRGARPIVVVHDLIPITHPDYCRPGERARHVARMTCAARIACRRGGNSHHTLEVLTGFCREHGAVPPAIVAGWRTPAVAASRPAAAGSTLFRYPGHDRAAQEPLDAAAALAPAGGCAR